eukprot:TRINITY_DN34954_c0_g1_i1.p1 TRINITY_DN34954_c0_g1~~TRINITY_DN34954_c0_g1_i1.p1  ORF type:complete len:929 (+),score=217.69 TRINITY_DN34954_c0_g1_i1:210-2996(+)
MSESQDALSADLGQGLPSSGDKSSEDAVLQSEQKPLPGDVRLLHGGGSEKPLPMHLEDFLDEALAEAASADELQAASANAGPEEDGHHAAPTANEEVDTALALFLAAGDHDAQPEADLHGIEVLLLRRQLADLRRQLQATDGHRLALRAQLLAIRAADELDGNQEVASLKEQVEQLSFKSHAASSIIGEQAVQIEELMRQAEEAAEEALQRKGELLHLRRRCLELMENRDVSGSDRITPAPKDATQRRDSLDELRAESRRIDAQAVAEVCELAEQMQRQRTLEMAWKRHRAEAAIEERLLLYGRWAFAVWETHLVVRHGFHRCDVLRRTLAELSSKAATDLLEREGQYRTDRSRLQAEALKLQSEVSTERATFKAEVAHLQEELGKTRDAESVREALRAEVEEFQHRLFNQEEECQAAYQVFVAEQEALTAQLAEARAAADASHHAKKENEVLVQFQMDGLRRGRNVLIDRALLKVEQTQKQAAFLLFHAGLQNVLSARVFAEMLGCSRRTASDKSNLLLTLAAWSKEARCSQLEAEAQIATGDSQEWRQEEMQRCNNEVASRDAEINAVKAELAAASEELTKATEAHDMETGTALETSEAREAALAATTKQLEIVLEETNRQHSASTTLLESQLQEAMRQNEADLIEQRRRSEAEAEEARRRHEAELAALRQNMEADMEAMPQHEAAMLLLESEVQEARTQNEAELSAQRRTCKAELEETSRQYEAELATARTAVDSDTLVKQQQEATTTMLAAEMQEARKQHEADLIAQRKECAAELAEAGRKYEAELAAAMQNMESDMEATQQREIATVMLETEMQEARRQHEADLITHRGKCEAELEEARRQYEAELAAATQMMEACVENASSQPSDVQATMAAEAEPKDGGKKPSRDKSALLERYRKKLGGGETKGAPLAQETPSTWFRSTTD